jgi:integration host factor subunit beta
MTQSDLIRLLADRADLTKWQARTVIKTIFGDMTSALMREEKIEIRNFGVLHTKHYPGYQGRNPRTGKAIQVRNKRMPFFKVGKGLLKRIQHALAKDEQA